MQFHDYTIQTSGKNYGWSGKSIWIEPVIGKLPSQIPVHEIKIPPVGLEYRHMQIVSFGFNQTIHQPEQVRLMMEVSSSVQNFDA